MFHVFDDDVETLRQTALTTHAKLGGKWQVQGFRIVCNEELERVVGTYLAQASPLAVAELAARARRLQKALDEAPRRQDEQPAVDGFFFRNARRFYREAEPQGEEMRIHLGSGHFHAARLWSLARQDPVGKHVRAGDLWPPDPACRYLRISLKLIERLDEMRDRVGSSFRILDGYRTRSYNGRVSRRGHTHVDGLAAHVTCSPARSALLCHWADRLFQDGGVGYIVSRQYVHVDVRGSRERWER